MTGARLPKPPVKATADLTDFKFMPLDVARLRDSDLAVSATDEEFRAAVLLWCVAWHQVPAGSVPDDDNILAKFAGYGRDVEGWKKVRDGALHGFVKCNDGRLYHTVVCEKVIDAFSAKKKQRRQTAAATRARQEKHRKKAKTESADKPRKTNTVSRNVARNEERNDDVTSEKTLRNVHQGTGTGTGTVEREERKKDPPKPPTDQTDPETETLPSQDHGEEPDPADTGGIPKILDRRDPPGRAGELAATVRAIYTEVCAVPVWYPSAKHRDAEWLETWAGQGFNPEDLNRVFRRVLAETSSAKPATLSYFEQPMARYATEFAWDLAYNLRPPQTDAEIANLEAERAARKAADEEASRRNHEAMLERLKAAAAREKAKRDKEFAE